MASGHHALEHIGLTSMHAHRCFVGIGWWFFGSRRVSSIARRYQKE